MAIPTFYYAFLDRPEFREAAQGWRRRPAVHLRLGADPAGGAARAGVDPGPAGDQPLRDDRGARHHQPAARRPLAAGLGGAAAGRHRGAGRRRRRHARGRRARSARCSSAGRTCSASTGGRPDATREAFASGWFDTGDLGSRDADGFLTLVGRKNDLIITNGFNVYPQVVERVINECPGVRRVGRARACPTTAAASAWSRPSSGPTPALDERALRAYCAERLVDYQRPAAIVFVDALPRNAMGKVLRRDLRDRLASEDCQMTRSPVYRIRATGCERDSIDGPGLDLAGGAGAW